MFTHYVLKRHRAALLAPLIAAIVCASFALPFVPMIGMARVAHADAATAGNWKSMASLATARWGHSMTALPNGRVLVAGGYSDLYGYLPSAELYDPASNTWSSAGNMAHARAIAQAVLLTNGKVLVTGGYDATFQSLATAELYDPATNSWSSAGTMAEPRSGLCATLLADGRVLVTGGGTNPYDGSYLASAELYDPITNTWSSAGTMAEGRFYHTATLLANGRVLVAGGRNATGHLASAELYDPATNTWSSGGSMLVPRVSHTATRLLDGMVLVVGGSDTTHASLASTELYDPATNTWSSAGSLNTPRIYPTATLLHNGDVLVTGGAAYGVFLASAELYNPLTHAWTTTGSMIDTRQSHTAVLLNSGQVLVAGGYHGYPLASVELYTVPDTTPPTTLATLAGQVGTNNWYVGPVTVTLSASDNPGGSGIAETRYSLDGGTTWQSYVAPLTITTDGQYRLAYRSTDHAGNVEASQTLAINIDQTPPTVTITGVRDGATYVFGSVPTAGYHVSDAASGVAAQAATLTSPTTTNQVGSYTYTVTATDMAGNTITQTVTYSVVYQFGGFVSPLAGQTFHVGQPVRVQFQVLTASGEPIANAVATLNINGYPATAQSSRHATTNQCEYDAKDHAYNYDLSTHGLAAGTTLLTVVLDDGTAHTAIITLK